MNIFKDLIKKYTWGFILSAATLDGYRRQYMNDRYNNILEKIEQDKKNLSEQQRKDFDRSFEENLNKTKYQASMGRFQEAADEHKNAIERYKSDPSEYNKNEIDKIHKKIDECFDEIKKLDISEYLVSLYNKYSEFLDSLTPDKIVCLFNIIIDGLILSSFLSVLSIMLSENIIKKISFLEKYPRILQLLKLRSYINNKVSKIYLLIHFIIIISGILGNIYMFFI